MKINDAYAGDVEFLTDETLVCTIDITSSLTNTVTYKQRCGIVDPHPDPAF